MAKTKKTENTQVENETQAPVPVVPVTPIAQSGRVLLYEYPEDCVTQAERQTYRRQQRAIKRKAEKDSQTVQKSQAGTKVKGKKEKAVVAAQLPPCDRCGQPAEGVMVSVVPAGEEDPVFVHRATCIFEGDEDYTPEEETAEAVV